MSDKFNEMSDEAQNIFFPLEIIELQEILGQIGLGQNTCIYIHVITGCCYWPWNSVFADGAMLDPLLIC